MPRLKIDPRIAACKKLHDLAMLEIGIHETPGLEATARILEYCQHTTLDASSDEVPWCSSFVNFITDMAGFPGTHSAAALSWLGWGVKLEAPIMGCIVIFRRPDPKNPYAGHVAFCDHPDISNGIIRVVGGNQQNSVCIGRYLTKNVLGYRTPI